MTTSCSVYSSSDVMCGKLLCDTTGKNLYTYMNYYLLSSASIGNSKCNSVIFDFGLKTQDPGLVPNGASCGDGMVTVEHITYIALQSLVAIAFAHHNRKLNITIEG